MTTKVRLPKYPAAYIKQMPEPVRVGLYDKACFLNGLDLADVIIGYTLENVGGHASITFEVFETTASDARLVKVKKAVALPHAPRYG
jgi:hypothetical protein